jgi:geranylgeranyl diphosphate synthase type II
MDREAESTPVPLPEAALGDPRGSSVPPSRDDRDRILAACRERIRIARPVPPLRLDELRGLADAVLGGEAGDGHRDFATILASNEAWRESLAAIPYDRRLLLLPQCLRGRDCQAPIDELGLLCRECGGCSIGELKREAESLGYMVMVAEGSAVVMSLISSGRIRAVIGASCLSVLEKMFPFMEEGAVPGIAIPLLRNGCKDTALDIDWLREAIALCGDAPGAAPLDLEALGREVDAWFRPEAIDAVLGPPAGETDRIARGWLGREGKRWRPLLVACAYRSFREEGPLDGTVRNVALAVECFHKASLVHDDIEDGHDRRYGVDTIHREYGVPIALNIGDLLVGEGYRLLAECGAAPEVRLEMLRVAAGAHRSLCRGQGAELCWSRRSVPPSSDAVIEIFREKTAPPFYVALRLGALAAGAGGEIEKALAEYSEALGIAYQIHDDLDDFAGEGGDLGDLRPSLLLALAHEKAPEGERARIEAVWRGEADLDEATRKAIAALGIEEAAREMLDRRKRDSVDALSALRNGKLKGLLRMMIGRVFRQGAAPGREKS